MSGIKLSCFECNTDFESKNINVGQNQAFCLQCERMYALDEIQRNSVDTSYKVNPNAVEGILELEDSKGYSIEVTWNKFSHYKFHLMFGVIVTLFTLPMSIILFVKLAIIGALICGLFALIGLYLLYIGLQEFFNTSMFFIDEQYFNVYHQPFGLFLNRINIPNDEIDQFYTKKISAGSSNGTEHFKHELWLDKKDNTSEKIVSIFKNEKDAFHLEHLLEKKLGIKDKLKLGEHRPGEGPNIEIPLRFVKALQKVKNERTQ